jgi:hypothetical protein
MFQPDGANHHVAIAGRKLCAFAPSEHLALGALEAVCKKSNAVRVPISGGRPSIHSVAVFILD